MKISQQNAKEEIWKIIINKKDYNTYKDFYIDIAKQLDAKNDLNCLEPDDLGYNPNYLREFLNDYNDEIHKYIFKNFDLEKIKNYKNYDNYEWNIIIEVFEDFVQKHPNNKLEFINEE